MGREREEGEEMRGEGVGDGEGGKLFVGLPLIQRCVLFELCPLSSFLPPLFLLGLSWNLVKKWGMVLLRLCMKENGWVHLLL